VKTLQQPTHHTNYENRIYTSGEASSSALLATFLARYLLSVLDLRSRGCLTDVLNKGIFDPQLGWPPKRYEIFSEALGQFVPGSVGSVLLSVASFPSRTHRVASTATNLPVSQFGLQLSMFITHEKVKGQSFAPKVVSINSLLTYRYTDRLHRAFLSKCLWCPLSFPHDSSISQRIHV